MSMQDALRSVARGGLGVVAGTLNVAKVTTLTVGSIATAAIATDFFTEHSSYVNRMNPCNANWPLPMTVIAFIASGSRGEFNCKDTTIPSAVQGIFHGQTLALPFIVAGTGLLAYTFHKMESSVRAVQALV